MTVESVKATLIEFLPIGRAYAVLKLMPNEKRLPHKPGQYLEIGWSSEDKSFSRYYSIASAARPDGSFDLCISLNDPGLQGLHWQDAEILCSPPAGNFFIPELHTPVVLIAGGSGITPLKAILEDRSTRQASASTALLYGCAHDLAIPFREELLALESETIRIHFFAEKVDGGLAELGRPSVRLGQYIDRGTDYLLCGPPQFMQVTREFLTDAGIDSSRIHQDQI